MILADRLFDVFEETANGSRPPLGDAVQDLRAEVETARSTTAEDVWAGFLRFGGRRYDSAGTPDADGLLLSSACSPSMAHRHSC